MKLIFLVFSILFLSTQPLNANAIGIGGAVVLKKIVDDSIGNAGDEAQRVLRRVEAILFALEGKFNEDIKERLEQVNIIVDNAINDINALEEKTVKDVLIILNKVESKANKLEKKFMKHLSEKIQEVECVGKRITLQDFEEAAGTLGDFFGTHRIKIDAPALYPNEKKKSCWFNCNDFRKEFEIKEPYTETYDEIKEFMLDRLENARNDTPVNTLLTTYEYIADLALRASCLAPSSADRLRTEYAKFYMKAYHWKHVFGPTY